LKIETRSDISDDWCSSVLAVAAFSSTKAEFCCVVSSSWQQGLVDLVDTGRLLDAGGLRSVKRCWLRSRSTRQSR
jgi:hypothetical protein